MGLFKRTNKYRVVIACGGYIPQYYWDGDWVGITKTFDRYTSPEYQQKYCVCETEKTAQTILDSYKAITE